MTYKEIEKIAIENGWTTKSDATLYYIEKEYEDSTNCIIVGKFKKKYKTSLEDYELVEVEDGQI